MWYRICRSWRTIETVDFEVKELENETVLVNKDVVGGVEVILVVIYKTISNFVVTGVVILIDIVDEAILI